MPRNRIISACENIFVSTGQAATGYMLWPGGTGFTNGGVGTVTGLAQIHRVQSANYSANVNRQSINQYGQLAAIDRIILAAPTVSLSLDYIVANAYNANTLGFSVGTQSLNATPGMLSGILAKQTDEKNYFISTMAEGADNAYNTDADSTKFAIGIGNGFITNFTAAGSVGNFATESVSIEALNLATYQGSTGLASPAIVPSGGIRASSLSPNNFSIPQGTSGVNGAVSAIRPGDITLSFGSVLALGPSTTDMKIQSYSLSVPLSRQPLSKLGSPFPFSKEIQFPITATLSVEAELGDMVTGDISSLYCADNSQTIAITLLKPQCGSAGPIAVQYKMLGAKLADQNYSSSVGADKKVSLKFECSVGGPTDAVNNITISGSLT